MGNGMMSMRMTVWKHECIDGTNSVVYRSLLRSSLCLEGIIKDQEMGCLERYFEINTNIVICL